MAKKGKNISYQTAASMKARKDKYYKIVSLITFFIFWEALCRINMQVGWIDSKFLPMPTGIIMAAYNFLNEGTLLGHIGISMGRVLKGYFIGIVFAVILGGLIASFRTIDNIFSPILNLFGPIPVMAFLPMFILWFGIGEQSKVILIMYATVIYMVPYVSGGINNTDPLLIRSAISLGANPLQVFFLVKFQSAFPNIFTGMKGALATAFGTMVVAEMMGASSGLGYIIVFSKNWFKMDDMIMAAIIIGLLYSVIFAILAMLEKRLFKWKKVGASNAIEQ